MSIPESLSDCFIVVTAITFCSTWAFHIAAFLWCQWKLNRKKSVGTALESQSHIGVSILKPLCGFDPNLKANLETYFTLNYSQYEILLCVQDGMDPCVKVVEDLMEEYPEVDARLFIGGKHVGVNPKINNMQPAYEVAKYPIILISDSGIRMRSDTLLNMMSYLTPRIAVVHQMPFTTDRPSFAAVKEKIYFGTFHARPYITADFLGVNCVNGMSCLVRKEALDQCGGLVAFGKYLAEDFFITKSLMERGWKITLCDEPAWQNSGNCKVSMFHDRIIRWTKLRFSMLPFSVFAELMTDCIVQGFTTAWMLSVLFCFDPILVAVLHFVIWCFVDWCLLRSIQNGPLNFSLFTYVKGWLCQTVSAPFLLAQALLTCGRIQWKHGTFRVRWGGIVEESSSKRRVKTLSKDLQITTTV